MLRCSVPDCNGRGHCTTEGICVCNKGWYGEFCEEQSCYPDPQCTGYGICNDGRCYCAENRWGDSCEKLVIEASTNAACSSPLIFTAPSRSGII